MFESQKGAKQAAKNRKRHLGFAECRFSSCTEEVFPIHERVTLAHCQRSPAPAMIYWLQNAGQPDGAAAFVHRATRDRRTFSLCPSLPTQVKQGINIHTHTRRNAAKYCKCTVQYNFKSGNNTEAVVSGSVETISDNVFSRIEKLLVLIRTNLGLRVDVEGFLEKRDVKIVFNSWGNPKVLLPNFCSWDFFRSLALRGKFHHLSYSLCVLCGALLPQSKKILCLKTCWGLKNEEEPFIFLDIQMSTSFNFAATKLRFCGVSTSFIIYRSYLVVN